MLQKLFLIELLAFSCVGWSQTGSLTVHLKVPADRKKEVQKADVAVWIQGAHYKTVRYAEKGFSFTIDSLLSDTFTIEVIDMDDLGDTLVSGVMVNNSAAEVTIPYPPYCRYDVSRNHKICPICGKKDEVVQIVYGLLIMTPAEGRKSKRKKKPGFYAGGCEITGCDPHWHCRRDNYSF